MKTKFTRVLTVGALCLMAGTSFAQRGGNNGGGNGNRPNFANMTPAQREAARAQQRERQLRQSLTGMGFAEPATQDAIVAFAKKQNAASTALLPKIEAIRTAFRDNADDATVSAALTAYRTAVTAAQTARDADIATLDGSISFSTNPKLEAFLTMMGIIGNENGFVSNLAGQAQLPGAGGGRGGRGGQGGFGGGGGQNGVQGGVGGGGPNGARPRDNMGGPGGGPRGGGPDDDMGGPPPPLPGDDMGDPPPPPPGDN